MCLRYTTVESVQAGESVDNRLGNTVCVFFREKKYCTEQESESEQNSTIRVFAFQLCGSKRYSVVEEV